MSGALGPPAPTRSSSMPQRCSSSMKRSSAPPSENGAAAANGKPSSPNPVLRLHLDYTDTSQDIRKLLPDNVTVEKAGMASLRYGLLAGAVLASIGVLVYLKRSNI